jgi:hypothetical protein
MFKRIAKWLKPGGIFLASLGYRDTPGWTGEWLGTTMYFSHFDAETNITLVEEAGLVIRQREIIGEEESGKMTEFLWVVAQKPSLGL